METPSSTRRVTRSQALVAANGTTNSQNILAPRKIEDSGKGVPKSRQRTGKQEQDRSILIDITNDSPIIGLASGNLKTPSSAMSKKRIIGRANNSTTPGSGEALLRGQVMNLLQKVEEEAEFSKLSQENPPHFLRLRGVINSPMGLLAPTPANTPHILNLSANGNSPDSGLVTVSPAPMEDPIEFSQMVAEITDGKEEEGDKCLITRSLLLDFYEKSEGSDSSSECSSVLPRYQEVLGGEAESEGREKLCGDDDDDEDASLWSVQVNASTRDEEEEEETEVKVDSEGRGRGLVDELCEGLSMINIDGGGERRREKATKFGKHIRFVYSSEGEIEGEETPKGKHLRFQEEDESEEEED